MGRKLRDELERDRYSDLTDREAAQDLNEERISIRRDVQVQTLGKYLLEQDLWNQIVNATDSQTQATADAAALVVDTCTAPPQAVDLDSAGLSGALDELVSAGVLTSNERSGIDALADETISRADRLGIGTVRAYDIEKARDF